MGTCAVSTGCQVCLSQAEYDDRDHQKGKWWTLFEHSDANWAFFEFEKPMAMPLMLCSEYSNYLADFKCEPISFDGDFDRDSRRFEIVSRGAYISQGFWEQFRREHPENYEWNRKNHQGAQDPSNPDPLFIAIGTCSPS